MKIVLHIIVFILLTAITQIGGVVYLISLLFYRKQTNKRTLKKSVVFAGLYLFVTFLIIPIIAPIFGREKIKETKFLKAHSFFYKLANRNYVNPELNKTLYQIALSLNNKNQGLKLIYLDANFPFIDKFPLLPHLSHNDGKKIDVTFIYEEENGKLTNKKPSVIGYGVYEEPKANEYNQTLACKKANYWQYDFPKYLSFGKINKDILFSEYGTKNLAYNIIKQKSVSKLFIEPHLKNRLKLFNDKVRFHGCRAVRHDDHIHFQIN